MAFAKALSIFVLVSLLVVSTSSALGPRHDALDGYTFDDFVADFGRTYLQGSAEYLRRKQLFEASLREVLEHNNKGVSAYKKGINHMSDWTEEEFAELLGLRPEMKAAADIDTKPLGTHQRGAQPLPEFLDWRNYRPSILTAVKDQGHCGSCWAHAAAQAVESAWAKETGNLFVLSQQQMSMCTPNPNDCGGTGGCGGGVYELAWDYIGANGGQAQEWTYPYEAYFGQNTNCTYNKSHTAPVANLSGYTQIAPNDHDALLDALAFVGPVAISVDASEWGKYESGVFDGCDYAKNISLNHAVQAVGYGYDDELRMEYWIIRNSWSAHWGENGYMKMMRKPRGLPASEHCGWNVHPQNGVGCKGQTAPQWMCGTCGIAFDAAFVNVSKNATSPSQHRHAHTRNDTKPRQPDYGSYIAICDSGSEKITFVNYPTRNCQAASPPTLFSDVLKQCRTETYQGTDYSWNAFCNSTHAWYNNFDGTECSGKSLVSRIYNTHKCMNCPNAICKTVAPSQPPSPSTSAAPEPTVAPRQGSSPAKDDSKTPLVLGALMAVFAIAFFGLLFVFVRRKLGTRNGGLDSGSPSALDEPGAALRQSNDA